MTNIMIPSVVQTRMERTKARRGYAEATDVLNDTLDDLHVAGDHDERAALLEYAADVTDRLAGLHTAAWGPEADADGRLVSDSLTTSAMLLRQVAATERAVLGTCTWLQPSGQELWLAHGHAVELLTWTQLAHTGAPRRRAELLLELEHLSAAHLGETAAGVLGVLAGTEEYRATGATTLPHVPRRALPRVLVAALLILVTVLLLASDPHRVRTLGLAAVVLAALYGAGRWADHRRSRLNLAAGDLDDLADGTGAGGGAGEAGR